MALALTLPAGNGEEALITEVAGLVLPQGFSYSTRFFPSSSSAFRGEVGWVGGGLGLCICAAGNCHLRKFSYGEIITKVCTKCNEVFEYWGCLE